MQEQLPCHRSSGKHRQQARDHRKQCRWTANGGRRAYGIGKILFNLQGIGRWAVCNICAIDPICTNSTQIILLLRVGKEAPVGVLGRLSRQRHFIFKATTSPFGPTLIVLDRDTLECPPEEPADAKAGGWSEDTGDVALKTEEGSSDMKRRTPSGAWMRHREGSREI